MKQTTNITPTLLTFNNKEVKGAIITVTSYFDFTAAEFFKQELIKENTLKIVKPLATAKFVKQGNDSNLWKEGFTYELNIRPFGLVSIWGTHHIKVQEIDEENMKIVTVERNNICKIWNHTLSFEKLSEKETAYTDEVILYAGIWTKILTPFLVYSYKVRHRNWLKLLTKTS